MEFTFERILGESEEDRIKGVIVSQVEALKSVSAGEEATLVNGDEAITILRTEVGIHIIHVGRVL
ncbi:MULTISPECIES: hypothetical protein [unclassified Psychrobacillus]|uniref:hypothetical protein n=1 Tax=unclassified Psychrobacillus TaxID=2636677 RepID=UPI0030F537B0